MTQQISLHVNGTRHSLTADPRTPLLLVLRNELGLLAAKHACGLEQCGACKVLVNGQAVPSCRRPVAEFVDAEITTLEGLTADGPDREQLHPVQAAFLAEQAAQCGYCTAGFIVGAAALLAQNPSPSPDEIRQALAGHLCRCGSYARILRAVQRAAGN